MPKVDQGWSHNAYGSMQALHCLLPALGVSRWQAHTVYACDAADWKRGRVVLSSSLRLALGLDFTV